MRCCDDLVVVTRIADAAMGSREFFSAVGELLATTRTVLLDTSPLCVALCIPPEAEQDDSTAGSRCDPRWRRWYPPKPGCLYEQLLSYRNTSRTCAPCENPLDELLTYEFGTNTNR